jgi:hypothetical protein
LSIHKRNNGIILNCQRNGDVNDMISEIRDDMSMLPPGSSGNWLADMAEIYQRQVANACATFYTAWPVLATGAWLVVPGESKQPPIEAAPTPESASDRPEGGDGGQDEQQAGNAVQSSASEPIAASRSERPKNPPTKRRHRPAEPRAKQSPRSRPADRSQARADGKLLRGLRDRSFTVKQATVAKMNASQKNRTPKALPLLQRIVDSKTVRERSPALRKAAEVVIEQTLQERGPKPRAKTAAHRRQRSKA